MLCWHVKCLQNNIRTTGSGQFNDSWSEAKYDMTLKHSHWNQNYMNHNAPLQYHCSGLAQFVDQSKLAPCMSSVATAAASLRFHWENRVDVMVKSRRHPFWCLLSIVWLLLPVNYNVDCQIIRHENNLDIIGHSMKKTNSNWIIPPKKACLQLPTLASMCLCSELRWSSSTTLPALI